jgi:uncharacterized protein (TIGR00369 family)
MVYIMRDAVSSTVGRSELLLTPHGGPEELFRTGPVTVDGGVARLTMATGPWLHDGDGRPAAGALGVLLDDLLGQAVIVHRPAGSWAVTTELTIDVGGPLPADGSRLDADAEPVSVDDAGGLSRGTVRAADGSVVAVGTTWSRFVPGVPRSVLDGAYGPASVRRGAGSLPELLGVGWADGVLVLPDRPDLVNPAGRVHGGVVACAAECAARRAVARSGLATASLRVTYVRPAVAPVVLTPTVLHGGRSLAVVEVLARGADARTCAIATVGLRSARPASPR